VNINGKDAEVELLDSLTINKGEEERSLELWYGDLTQIPPNEAVDVLVVSAFPNDYSPMPRTLIGNLSEMGISVKELSKDKLFDLRDSCSCWLSKKIESSNPSINFNHILCFEPFTLGSPPDVVGDIFRSLVPFIIGEMQVTQVAMPLVSTGNAGASIIDMVDALFNAAVHNMEAGLPLKRLKIVERSKEKAAEIKGAFAILKKQYHRTIEFQKHKPEYDLFISYSHENTNEANNLIDYLKMLIPDVRIFIDREGLVPGLAWQDKLFRSIDNSRKVVVLYSPHYVKSKMCQEEFNFSSLLNSRTGEKTLFPILLYDTDLLPQMSRWQYIDCRIADKDKMHDACNQLIKELVEV
jgi:hypothetical protein